MATKNLTSFEHILATNKHIGLDTMCFIYQYANHPTYAPLTNAIIKRLSQDKLYATTSIITVIETLTLPEKANQVELVRNYQKVFEQLPNLSIVAVDYHLALLASKLRSNYPNIRTPDAIQLSAAILNQCDIFVTNDKQLKQVTQIKVCLLSDYA